jgi:cephalosporin hydroxylase/glycosyltransferase involved in cell wall biosynthesis
MKFSFLIPSKDRLDLLKLAVASIREQPDLDYEIVIVDNCSRDDYTGYVRGLNDARVVFKRQASPVSVTQNWQDSLALATGEYVLMLGDDDALAPDFTREITKHLENGQPDVIYVAAYHYCYPNVIPGHEAGYLASVLNSEFLQPGGEPFFLDRGYAAELAISNLDFRHRFGLNAQHYVLKASFIAQFRAQGGLYQSPYPDTYSSVAIFLHAESILVIQKELVIIGISPKSFGAYYFSGRHDDGYVFLDNLGVTPEIRDSLQPVILPGDRNDTNWLIAAEAVRQAFPDRLGDRVNIERYRTLQMIAVLRTSGGSKTPSPIVEELRIRLSPSERMTFKALEAAVRSATASGAEARARLFTSMSEALEQYHPAKVSFVDIGPHATVADALVALRTPSRGGQPDDAVAEPTSAVPEQATVSQAVPNIEDLQTANTELRGILHRQQAVSRLAGAAGSRFEPPALSTEQQVLVDNFVRFVYSIPDKNYARTYFCSWMGYEMFKWPTDVWSYQEIVSSIRPDVIIETGTYRGGSALFLASLCDLLNHGEVVTVDVDTTYISSRPQHPRVTYLNGSSTSPEIVSEISRIVAGRSVVVILDSDHRRDHVLEEMRLYHKFVQPGSYLIVEDTLVNGHPAFPEFGPGPWEAIEEFMRENEEFVIDRSSEKVFLSQNPGGYLRRKD